MGFFFFGECRNVMLKVHVPVNCAELYTLSLLSNVKSVCINVEINRGYCAVIVKVSH